MTRAEVEADLARWEQLEDALDEAIDSHRHLSLRDVRVLVVQERRDAEERVKRAVLGLEVDG